jgi:ABC-type microcin C transport system permease subunit YejE
VVSLRELIRGPTLLTLVYYRCPNACDLLLSDIALALLPLSLRPGSDYQVLSVSIDERETPADAREAKRIALAFGLLAALGTTVTTMIISAVGVWFGGWVDELIQRITEVNLVLPFLSILVMVGTFYSKSIWLMLSASG